ncbi:WLM domain-containing protein [Biscogniauxia mediterranea]|nr:WLM domain-containing protein [Biscogniauxia mediterranea]
MPEIDPLIMSYSHLNDMPRSNEALLMLKKIASMVKPLMRKRGWKVGELAEFYPKGNLLGLNYDQGRKICLALRYPGDRNQFFPIEAVVDTMLHELSHNVHGPHNEHFHRLWDELRDEHSALLLKGYTGEGFLSPGQRLGGRRIPRLEARRLARAEAERRRNQYIQSGSGQRLGGKAPHRARDMRSAIADATERRIRSLQGCANDNQSPEKIRHIAETTSKNGFKTQAEEDEANEVAITQALMELIQEEEDAKRRNTYAQPNTDSSREGGSRKSTLARSRNEQPAIRRWTENPDPFQDARTIDLTTPAVPTVPSTWTCHMCTLINSGTSLACEVCDTKREQRTARPGNQAEGSSNRERTTIDLTRSDPQPTRRASASAGPSRSAASSRTSNPVPKTWRCHECGRIREHTWWSCDICGAIKRSS